MLPRGTTTAICDPHEIANVLGLAGIRYFLAAAETLRMSLRVQLSSCVPATDLETSGARLEAADLVSLRDHPAVIGLAEMMNFPGVLAKDERRPRQARRLRRLARRRPCAARPRLRPQRLSRGGDPHRPREHELRGGRGEAREGHATCWRAKAASPRTSPRSRRCSPTLTWPSFAFCTDDRNPLEIAEEGHIDYAIRKAIRPARRRSPPIARRASPRRAPSACSIAARSRAGRRADIVLLDDLESCAVAQVICGGVPSTTQALRRASRRSPRSAMARSGGHRSRPRSSRSRPPARPAR